MFYIRNGIRKKNSFKRLFEINFSKIISKEIVKEETKSGMTKNEDDDIKVYIKPLADEPAFNKGVEYFSEIFFFYNILMLLALYELKKASDSATA